MRRAGLRGPARLAGVEVARRQRLRAPRSIVKKVTFLSVVPLYLIDPRALPTPMSRKLLVKMILRCDLLAIQAFTVASAVAQPLVAQAMFSPTFQLRQLRHE